MPAARTDLARSAMAAHADLRDATSAAMVAAGLQPAEPQADYPLGPVRTAAAATANARPIPWEAPVISMRDPAIRRRLMALTLAVSSGVRRNHFPFSLPMPSDRAKLKPRLRLPSRASAALPTPKKQ